MATLIPHKDYVLRYCRDFTLKNNLPTSLSFSLKWKMNEKEASVNWLECLCPSTGSSMQISCSINKARELLKRKNLPLCPEEKLARMNVDQIIKSIPEELGYKLTVNSKPSQNDPSHAVISGYYDGKHGNLKVRKALAKLAREDLYPAVIR